MQIPMQRNGRHSGHIGLADPEDPQSALNATEKQANK